MLTLEMPVQTLVQERPLVLTPLWQGRGWSLHVRIQFGLGRISNNREEQSQLQSLGFTPPQALRSEPSAPLLLEILPSPNWILT